MYMKQICCDMKSCEYKASKWVVYICCQWPSLTVYASPHYINVALSCRGHQPLNSQFPLLIQDGTVVLKKAQPGLPSQAAWQGRGTQRLEELSEHGQARASQHWSPDGKRSGERKRPTFHPLRSRTVCVQPDKYWHCFNSILGETAEKWVRAHMGLSERYCAILSWNWNWSPKGCPHKSTDTSLVEHWSSPSSESGTLTISFLTPLSFRQWTLWCSGLSS